MAFGIVRLSELVGRRAGMGSNLFSTRPLTGHSSLRLPEVGGEVIL